MFRLGPKSKPGKASDYLQDVHEFFKDHPSMEVYLLLREPARTQEYRRNHDNYERLLRPGCKELGIPVRDCIRITTTGKIVESEWRRILMKIVRWARKRAARTGKTVGILAFSTDRFLRNANYKSAEPDLLPTRWEYRKLKWIAGDVPLLTWVNPDMPPPEVRGLQAKLGQDAKGNKGGGDRKPGWMKRRRARLLPEVLRLRRKGLSYGRIAKHEHISIRTAWNWAKECR
jgi:hypothetical protein